MTETRDRELLRALRRGDEQAFSTLVQAHHSALLRVALAHVPSRAVAEEVVQDTWLGVLRGLDRFEGRASLKTWIFKIAANIARSRGARERRTVPFASLAAAETGDEPSVDPDRFFPPDHAAFPEHWTVGPRSWHTPEERLLSGERRQVVLAAIADLPPAQRTVIGLRDIEGWASDEVCHALGISAGNQRVLLHRARTTVRAALDRYHAAPEPAPVSADATTGYAQEPVAAI